MAQRVPAKAQEAKPRKPRTPVPENESGEQKFRRLGTMRLNRAVKAIDSLAFLAGPSYSYTSEQAATIREQLVNAVGRVGAAFDKPQKGKSEQLVKL